MLRSVLFTDFFNANIPTLAGVLESGAQGSISVPLAPGVCGQHTTV